MSKKKIPFFNYPLLFEQRKEEYLEVLADVHLRGAYIMQSDLCNFEKSLSKYLNVKNVIGVADGTMALLMSLMAVGIKEGDEVILPGHTFIASAAAINHLGAKPILADCSQDHLIDPKSIEQKLSKNTKAIMPVQLNGRVVNMDPILEIAKKNNLLILEDSCQALGATFRGKYAGTFGIAGAFSFYPSKTLGCFGDGGAVITDSNQLAEEIRLIRDHGRDPKDGKVKIFGFNGRLDNVHAAILGLKLKYYDEDIKKRRQLASIYDQRLNSLSELLLPPSPNSNSDHFDVYQNYEIEADNRDNLRAFLDEKGIGTILQWGGFTLNNFEGLGMDAELPYTDNMTARFMMLPMHPMLREDEVNYICDQIIEFYRIKKS